MKKIKRTAAMLLSALLLCGSVHVHADTTIGADQEFKEHIHDHYDANEQLRLFADSSYKASTIVNYANEQLGSTYYAHKCLAWVRSSFESCYGFSSSDCCAYKYGSSYIDSYSRDNIPLGADVFFGGSSVTCNTCKNKAGHIGIYVGNGYIIHSWSGKVQKTTIDYVVGCGYPYRGWGWHGNVALSDAPLTVDDIEVPASTVKSGSKGSEVIKLQNFLNFFENAGLAADGSFGPATLAAVKNFQSKYGLEADGSAGPATRAKMAEVLNNRKNQAVNHDPKGSLDGIGSDYGTINITGWTFDEDDLSAQLRIHVYVGGEAGSTDAECITKDTNGNELIANAARTDVDEVYHSGAWHGFNASLKTTKTGQQPVYIYAINNEGGNNPCIGSGTINIPQDTEAPVISEVHITNVAKDGYTVYCTVTDNNRLAKVEFPSWNVAGGETDLLWHLYSDNINSSSAKAWYRVNTSEHNNAYGEYITHIYAWDQSGNSSSYAAVSDSQPVLVQQSYDHSPVDSFEYNNNRYEVYDAAMSYAEMVEFCEKKGGHIVTVNDKAENDEIAKHLKQGYYYIGYNNISGKWAYGDSDYRNWNTDEPNNQDGTGTCTVIEAASGRWNDTRDENYKYDVPEQVGFVLEYEKAEEKPEAPVSAVKITGASVKAGKGTETISVPISISNNPGICSLGFDVEYDSSAMTLTGVDNGAVFAAQDMTSGDTSNTPYTVSLSRLSDVSDNGRLVVLNFRLNDNAAEGSYSIKLSKGRLGGASNIEEKEFALVFEDASVTVAESLLGDVNNDGAVTRADLTRLSKYFAGWDAEINTAAADVTGDGVLTRADLTRLSKYFAGWDVELS